MRRLQDIPPNVDEIRNEIEERRNLIKLMVGTLYPNVLVEEIAMLYQKLDKVRLDDRSRKNTN